MTNLFDRLLMKFIPRAASDEPVVTDLPTTTDETDVAVAADQKAIARISAILTCEEAHGRQKLAQHLALHTDFTLENAKAALSAAGREGVTVITPDTGKPDAGALTRAQHNNFFIDHQARYPELWN